MFPNDTEGRSLIQRDTPRYTRTVPKGEKSMDVRSTAKAIIIDNNRILLNKCYDKNNGHYYSLPGGGQNKYETLQDAIIRECLEETGYDVIPIRFCGICEEICDNKETREFYSQYAHKLYHIYLCHLASDTCHTPTEVDDMQESCQWMDIRELDNIRLLPTMVGDNIKNLINSDIPIDMGSIHIPYNHG